MNPERRLAELGIELPPASKPMGTYVPWVQTGNLLFLSGLGPRRPDGTFVAGKLGAGVSIEQGREAARIVGLNMLANIRAALGSLDRVERVVKTLGMVNSAPGFTRQPSVINGFSDLILELYGPEIGAHSRSAVGMAELPFNIPVEIEAEVEIRV